MVCINLEEKENYMADERAVRLQRLHALREKGINPYPNSVERTHTIAEVLKHFEEWQGEEGDFTLTGRIRLMRVMGKAAFAQIEDGTGRMQVFFGFSEVGEDAYNTLKLLIIATFLRYVVTFFSQKQESERCVCENIAYLRKGCVPYLKSIMDLKI